MAHSNDLAKFLDMKDTIMLVANLGEKSKIAEIEKLLDVGCNWATNTTKENREKAADALKNLDPNMPSNEGKVAPQKCFQYAGNALAIGIEGSKAEITEWSFSAAAWFLYATQQ